MNLTTSSSSPFGMQMQNRTWEALENGYRFGFGGQERDDKVSGSGNSYTAAYWQYDSRLGRRFNLDPKQEVDKSPYSCFRNNPVLYVDLKGDTTWLFDLSGNLLDVIEDQLPTGNQTHFIDKSDYLGKGVVPVPYVGDGNSVSVKNTTGVYYRNKSKYFKGENSFKELKSIGKKYSPSERGIDEIVVLGKITETGELSFVAFEGSSGNSNNSETHADEEALIIEEIGVDGYVLTVTVQNYVLFGHTHPPNVGAGPKDKAPRYYHTKLANPKTGTQIGDPTYPDDFYPRLRISPGAPHHDVRVQLKVD